MQGRVQDQRGCASCSIYEEDAAESAVVLVERWTCREELDAHLRSDIFKRVIAAIELSAGPPDIRFEHVSATEGDRGDRTVARRGPDDARGRTRTIRDGFG